LVDLAVEWLLQYSGESTVIDSGSYPGVGDRLGQVEGYLSASALAVVWFGPAPGDRPDPWGEAGELLARIEAEFPGRLLTGPEDVDRFDQEPEGGLTWAVAGLRGVSAMLQSQPDSGRLARLVDRGVRAFRLAGLVDHPPAPGEDLPLAIEDRRAIETIASAARSPMMLDLAGLGPRASGEAIDAVEESKGSLVPIVSLGGSSGRTIAGLRPEDFDRIKQLGGVVGLGVGRAFHRDADELADAIGAIAGRGGPDGVAIGTGFLGIEEPSGAIEDAPALLDWCAGRFDPETASRLCWANARQAIRRAIGGR
jgi:membrane dipeptidase